MVYVLIISIVTVILASILAIRPTAQERLIATIRSHAMEKGWKIRFATEKDLESIYHYPLIEQVICYYKYHDETTRQTHCEPWGFYNETDNGVLVKKYQNLYPQNVFIENKSELKAQRLKIIKSLFQDYGETLYGVEFNQSGFFFYWNEKINESDAGPVLNLLSQLLDQ